LNPSTDGFFYYGIMVIGMSRGVYND